VSIIQVNSDGVLWSIVNIHNPEFLRTRFMTYQDFNRMQNDLKFSICHEEAPSWIIGRTLIISRVISQRKFVWARALLHTKFPFWY
jgi:hypothetical protein